MRFAGQYDMVAPLYGTTPRELRERDDRRGHLLERWMVARSGSVVGAVTTWVRPDRRTFLTFGVETPDAYEPLTRAVDAVHGRPLHTTIDESDREHVVALHAAGFQTEMVGERFRIDFDNALSYLRRAWIPSGYELRSASDVEEARLFALDNAIRRLVPGTDGWQGDADLFHEELTESPPYDPSAYLVAVERSSNAYVGLVRIWRNADGPRLGLVGVLPNHRSQPVAAALLKHALSAAAGWGHDTFATEISPSNTRLYPRVARLDTEPMGRFLQLVRATEGTVD